MSTVFGIWDAYYPRITTMVVNWEVDLSEQFAEVVASGGWGGGSCQPTGSVPVTPTAPSLALHGDPGTATWQYYLLVGNATGSSAPGAIAMITGGPTALSSTSFIHLSWAAVAGATPVHSRGGFSKLRCNGQGVAGDAESRGCASVSGRSEGRAMAARTWGW